MLTESQKELTTSRGKASIQEIWTKQIEAAGEREKNYRKEARGYINIYENNVNSQSSAHPEGHNVFWSNTQTLRPLVFSNLPAPNITRRFFDDSAPSRILSEMIERSLSYFQDEDNVYETYSTVRDDFLVPGRGVARVIFDPPEVITIPKPKPKEKEKEEAEELEDEMEMLEGEEEIEEVEEELDSSTKKVRVEYVEWDNIRFSAEKTWRKVTWVAFKHLMNKDELIERFGSKGKDVELNYSILDEDDDLEDDIFKQAEVWEVWDKLSKKIIWLTTGKNGSVLSHEDDEYNLKEFFPIARPLGSDSSITGLTPIPLFRMYRSQANELNVLDARIRNLVEQVKFTGVYSTLSESTNIEAIMSGNDGEITPLKGLQPGVRIADQIEFKPIIDLVNTINSLRQQKGEILQNIRDITGLSDIVRGTTLASETATAQKLKGDFAISRIQPLQKEFELFIRDTERLRAELIVEQYSIEELAKITNLQIVDINTIAEVTKQKQDALFQEAVSQLDSNDPKYQEQIQQLKAQQEAGFKATMKKPLNDLKGYAATPEELIEISKLMKDDKSRSFSIDIETDNTVRIDQNQEKQDRLEYTQAISSFFSQATPILQIGGMSKSTFNEMLGFISKPFKVGRNLEEHLLSEEEPEEPKGPSVEEQMAMADNQRKDQELQLKAKEVDIKQQEVNVKKAQVKVSMEQFDDKLEFEDVNKEADRRAKTTDQIAKIATNRVTDLIRTSNLV